MKSAASLIASLVCLAACLCVLVLTQESKAWTRLGANGNIVPRWNNGTNVFVTTHSSVWSKRSSGGANFGNGADRALNEWNRYLTGITLYHIADPNSSLGIAANDGRNSVYFNSSEFSASSNTLAFTTSWVRNGVRTEGDILFNSRRTWDYYNGAVRNSALDFKRVFLHEVGHLLGLGHPHDSGQTVSAIMNQSSHRGDLYKIDQDDIWGVTDMYGTGPRYYYYADTTFARLARNGQYYFGVAQYCYYLGFGQYFEILQLGSPAYAIFYLYYYLAFSNYYDALARGASEGQALYEFYLGFGTALYNLEAANGNFALANDYYYHYLATANYYLSQ